MNIINSYMDGFLNIAVHQSTFPLRLKCSLTVGIYSISLWYAGEITFQNQQSLVRALRFVMNDD